MNLWRILPDWLTGYDAENARRAAAADAELRRINAERAALYGPEWYEQVQEDYASQSPFGEEAQRDEIARAAQAGWEQGRRNVSAWLKETLNKILADPLRALIGGIPWWLWLVGILALLWWLGVLPKAIRKLKGKFA